MGRAPMRPRAGVTDGIHWRARGEGPALVLLNGYGAAGTAWPTGWVEQLEGRHRVIAPDLRGTGWSRSVRVPFTVEDLADDVVRVLDELELDRATVLGLSMGGMVAQEVALAAADRVAGLVLVATRPPVPRFVRPRLGATLRLALPPLPGTSLTAYYRDLWSAAAAPGFVDRRPDLIDELVQQTLDRPTPQAMLRHQLGAMMAWGHAERLQRLVAPTAIVHGTADRFAPVANGRALAELIPAARYDEAEGVGHLVPLEAPERIDEALRVVAGAG